MQNLKKNLVNIYGLRAEDLIKLYYCTVICHDNILEDKEGWIVIDPKGVVGEPAYEVGAFIRNPIPDLLRHEEASNIIQNRISLFSKRLDIPAHKIAGWALVQAVLAWVWALEDNGETAYWKKITKILFYLS
jgi:streptomycin 6-kinase